MRLARKGLIPHLILPGNEVRFDVQAIQGWLAGLGTSVAQASGETVTQGGRET